ncbi:putative Ig domain-containing protein [Stenotrophomonas sp. GD03958]|uniref:putative Ig domain-containing protein n=1 Tax=Stenotrophomonas sp. GD03958 TaxID=2975411 RepID=UPI00244A3F2C|nr:putative Ig domain-containing protein [Stenotrophomonas sp. GD03958]MDH1192525.1 putative Ig domain-containing protein [Stenotrophomonas sp. GD03958]
MAAPFWQAGTLYLPGDLVQPVTQPPPNNPQVANGNFAGGATGWTFSGDASYTPTNGYGGGGCVQLPGNKPDGVALNNTMLDVPVGGQLTATSLIQQGASVAGATAGWTEIRWYDGLNTLLQTDKGNVVDSGSGGAWHPSTVVGTRPAAAAYARAGIHLTSVADHNHEIFGDNLSVSGASAGLPDGLVYKAVQVESGFSGSSEPAWPGILGQQVIDNEVIWEAVTTSRVTWTAAPRYVSGATEPTWPTDIGAMVQDGTLNWRAISRRVEDEKCPQSKVVAIVASKVFAADKDIVRFSATANPLDWSTADDAGYLPTGLQQANANDIAVLAPYRANLAPMNASSFQNWQVDPDPASMALLDQMDGIGSIWPKAAVPVSNDLFYLSQLGVRTVGIANAAENLAAGDVGAPIDDLVRAALRVSSGNGSKVIGTYYPGAGQYWLAFSEYPQAPLSLSGGIDGDAYLNEIVDARYIALGGVTPYRFEVVAGSLPTGITMNQNSGVLSGSFAQKGNFAWTVRVTDALGEAVQLDDQTFICNLLWNFTTWFAGGAYASNYGAGRVIWSDHWQRFISCTGPGRKISTDGITWVPNGTGDYLGVAENPATNRLVCAQNNNQIYTSDDGGTTVTLRATKSDFSASTVRFVNGQFTASLNVQMTVGGADGVVWSDGPSFSSTLGVRPAWEYIEHLGLFLFVQGSNGTTGTSTSALGPYTLTGTIPGWSGSTSVKILYIKRTRRTFILTAGLIRERLDNGTYVNRLSAPGLSITDAVDIPEMGAIVAVGSGGQPSTAVSVDGGTTWTRYNGLNSFRLLAWSEPLKKIVAIGQNVASYATPACEV